LAAPADRDRFDHHLMGIALGMARRGLGRTSPNPSVGAVLVDPATGEILARAVTANGGRPHAEPLVIAAARARCPDRVRGATLYVTLEPCSHHGRTPPCADGVIAAGIGRVVCGVEDPDPRVAGRGLHRLREAGIIVTRGVRGEEARTVTAGHICRVAQRRPFVQLKLALDGNGNVPRGTGSAPTFVTSPEARALGHLLRAQSDAILVGRGTVAADDPELTCRLPGMAARSPHRVVLARDGLDIARTRLAATMSIAPVTVMAGSSLAAETRAAITAAGAELATVAVVGEGLWLPAVLEHLTEGGTTRLLVEGGPSVWRAFARAGLVDEVVLFVAGAGMGSAAVSGAPAPSALVARHLGPLSLTITDHRTIGTDRVWWLEPRRSGSRRQPIGAASPGDGLPGADR
jgi:diaminohydroxyphosphoribosylaminopyrimidine deaminase/5-amino-6-(5-phosphoribosylamino)uracil reductase